MKIYNYVCNTCKAKTCSGVICDDEDCKFYNTVDGVLTGHAREDWDKIVEYNTDKWNEKSNKFVWDMVMNGRLDLLTAIDNVFSIAKEFEVDSVELKKYVMNIDVEKDLVDYYD